MPKSPGPHKDSTSSESSVETEPDLDMAATGATKDLIEALTKTLKILIKVQLSPYLYLKVRKEKTLKIIF